MPDETILDQEYAMSPARRRIAASIASIALAATGLQLAAPAAHATTFSYAADTAFNNMIGGILASGVSPAVKALAVQSDGSIIAGGSFSGRLRKLDSTGYPDYTWGAALSPNSPVNAIAINPNDGSVIVAGAFAGGLAKLSASGTVDTAFSTNVGSVLSTGGGTAFGVAIDPADGSIAVTGNFLDGLKRFNSSGNPINGFNGLVSLNGGGRSVAIEATTHDIVVGSDSAPFLQRFHPNGSEDVSMATSAGPSLDDTVNALAQLSDGSIVATGSFTGGVKKFSNAGVEDSGYTANVPSFTWGFAAARLSDDTVVVGNLGGDLLHLTATGAADTAFTSVAGTLSAGINALAVRSNDDLVVGGAFNPGRLTRFTATVVPPSNPGSGGSSGGGSSSGGSTGGGSTGGGSTVAPTVTTHSVGATVTFGKYSPKLTEAAKKKLRTIYAKAKAGRLTAIDVTAKANPLPSGGYKKTAKARAAAIAKYLKSLGATVTISTKIAKGKGGLTGRSAKVTLAYTTSR